MFPVPDPKGGPLLVCSMIVDVTEQRLLETRLCYAEKMKAIGQLSSGVAHDFNNVLAVILGNADLLSEVKAGDPLIAAIIRAAERGRQLTHRLLAYSRKQALRPVPIDLHRLVLDIEDMLRRTLGEGIDSKILREPDLWPVLADPSQV